MNNLTHYDLDGAVSSILLSYYLKIPMSKVVSCGYNNIENKILNLDKTEPLIISDLSVDENLMDKLVEFDDVTLLDHHESSADIKYPFKTMIKTGPKYSGSILSCLYLYGLGHKIKSEHQILAKIANDYDNFIFNEKKSMLLNDIFWDIKFDEFFIKYYNGYKYDEKLENKALENAQHKKEKILKFDTYLVEGVRIVIANDLISDISLVYDEDLILIVREDFRMSIRSKNNMLSLYEIIKENILDVEIGGHKNAGGLLMKNPEDAMNIIELAIKWNKNQNN